MTGKRKQYTQEFKDSAVKLVTEQGYRLSEASRSHGDNVSVLRRWKNPAEPGGKRSEGRQSSADLQVELARLKKENHRLKLEREILKKSGGLLRQRIGERYRLIDAEKKVYPISLLCEVLGVCRSGYYGWIKRGKSSRQKEYDELIPIVQDVHKVSKGTYGAKRMDSRRDRSSRDSMRAAQSGNGHEVGRCRREPEEEI